LGFLKKVIKYFLPYFATEIYHKINEKRLLEEALENEKRQREERIEKVLKEALEEEWDYKNISYNKKIITIQDVCDCIDVYCKMYTYKDKDYYMRHAFRYFVTLYYVIKYNLHTGRILQVDDMTSFFAYLMKYFLEVDKMAYLYCDLRKPVEPAHLFGDLQIPFEPGGGQFDVIICMEVFEHIMDTDVLATFTFNGLKTMLNSFWELLNENGKILITTPNSCGVFSLSNLLHSKNPLMWVFHPREYTPNEIKEILRAFNYEIDLLNTEYLFEENYYKNGMLLLLKDNYFDIKHRGDNIFMIARKPPNKIFNVDVNINDILIKQ
jgi:hypothetical protein